MSNPHINIGNLGAEKNSPRAMMGQTTVVLNKRNDDQLSKKGDQIETHSEVRPSKLNRVAGPGKVLILPNGVIDDRDHDQPFVIKEQIEEYDNFDKNSYFASSLDDHDK